MVISDLNYLEVVSEPNSIKGGRRLTRGQRYRRNSVRTIAYASGNGSVEAQSYSYASSTSDGVTTSSYDFSQSSDS
jgi:hypothetical protein